MGRSLRAGSVAALLAALAGCAPGPARSTAPPAPCLADLDAAAAAVSADYAGYRERSTGREAALAALTDSLRRAVERPSEGFSCGRAIQRWLAFFDDPHLSVTGGEPTARASTRPAPRAPRPPRGDRLRPSLRLLDAGTALLRLPSFELEHAGAIDSIVSANRALLLATPHLIVDVRRNAGGLAWSYAPVLPLLYTAPIQVWGWETWSSPRNLTELRATLGFPGIPEPVAAQIRSVLPRMAAAPGEFVPLEEDHELRLDTVFPLPRAVAVLVDRGCASSCEQFALDARQSAKVVVIGAEPTRGALVYGNVRSAPLPSGARELWLPMARSRWARLHPDETRGIAPDVRVPADETDLVAYAQRHLAARIPRP